MLTANANDRPPRPRVDRQHIGAIPPEFLRVIAVWSLIPAYLLAGGFLGYLVDRWLNSWPYGLAIGIMVALGFAVRDMLRLRDSW